MVFGRIKSLLIVVLFSLGFSACSSKGGGSVLEATGKPGEVMLVIDNEYLSQPMGHTLVNLLESEVPGMPSVESSMSVSMVPPASFKDFLRWVRNVVIVNVDPQRFSTTTIKLSYNDWAQGQQVLHIQSPSADSLDTYLHQNSELVLNLLVRHELYKFGKVLSEEYSKRAMELTDSVFAHRLNVPNDIRSHKARKDFLWMSNAAMRRRHDVLVYSYPYNSPKDIGLDRIVEARDSVLKQHIAGEFEDSYPTTEKKFGLEYRKVQSPNEPARGEVRGLWKMEGKSMMGGPFVCQAYPDIKAGKVYVVEGFVYHPNENKRDLMRMMEAALYSFRPSSVEAFDPQIILQSTYTKSF